MNTEITDHIFLHFIKKFQYKNVAEIGVYGGNLTGRVVSSKDCPVENYYCVDPWVPYWLEIYGKDPGAENDPRLTLEWWENIAQKVYKIQEKYPVVKIVRMRSAEGAKYLQSQGVKLDFVYIDGKHTGQAMILDLYHWLPLIKDDGMIGGHDYVSAYKDMTSVIDKTFGDDLNLIILDESKSSMAHKNTGQGGNWWVFLNKESKMKSIKSLEDNYPDGLKDDYKRATVPWIRA